MFKNLLRYSASASLLMGLVFNVSANAAAVSESVTDKLLTHLLNQQLQQPLLKVDGIPWPAGTYGITISPAGVANINSVAKSVEIGIPLQTRIVGKVSQDLGFTKVAMDCKSGFDHIGQLKLTPNFKGQKVTFVSELNLPIPPVNAECGGMSFPVQDVLKQLVAANKLQWEKDINQVLAEQFNQPAKPAKVQP